MSKLLDRTPGLLDRAAGAIEQPTPLESVGRGMTDLYEPLMSAYLAMTDPNKRQAYDNQRKSDETLYLRGLLGDTTKVPESLRGAVPDMWRGLGQAAPFFALGPAGGLPRLTLSGLLGALSSTAKWSAFGQPAMYAPELWNYLDTGQK